MTEFTNKAYEDLKCALWKVFNYKLEGFQLQIQLP